MFLKGIEIKKAPIFITLFLTLFLFVAQSFGATFSKPEFRLKELYHYELRRTNHKLYTNRFSLSVNYLNTKKITLFKITPFFELRRNIHKGLWERKEAGVEIDKDIFPWLYVGEAIQRGWMKEDYRYYGDYESRDYTESETRLCFAHNLISNKHIQLRGFILNEYTYDFDRGAGTRNEVAVGFVLPLNRHIETEINWRHIDRVHYYDSDTFEGALTLIF